MRSKYGPRPQNPTLARLEKQAKQSKAYHASAGLERSLAKRTGGHRTAGSGNKLEKGDVRVHGVARLEHKATQHASFRVTIDMLDKIEHAARACDEVPAMVIDFLDERGRSTGREIACIPLKDLLDLIDERATQGANSEDAEPARATVRKRPHRR